MSSKAQSYYGGADGGRYLLKFSKESAGASGGGDVKTLRSQLHTRRVELNTEIEKEDRIADGSRRLLGATRNTHTKNQAALEMSFSESKIKGLQSELGKINSSLSAYQAPGCDATQVPIIPLAFKATHKICFEASFRKIAAAHYHIDPATIQEAIQTFQELRNSVSAVPRTEEGLRTLLEYNSQLKHASKRFIHPKLSHGLSFTWYDAINGRPYQQQTAVFERACVLFNVAALYSQLAAKVDRESQGLTKAVDLLEKAAGMFEYVRDKFSQAPSPDLSTEMLSMLADLMRAQAQELVCDSVHVGSEHIDHAHKAKCVADCYAPVREFMERSEVKGYLPDCWVMLVKIKEAHYKALSHYHAAMAHWTVANVLSDGGSISEELRTDLHFLYIQSPPELNDNLSSVHIGLVQRHLNCATLSHEFALKFHSLCRDLHHIEPLAKMLAEASEITSSQMAEATQLTGDTLILPSLQASGIAVHSQPPNMLSVRVPDLFRVLGPLPLFSADHQWSPPRSVRLDNTIQSLGLSIRKCRPVLVSQVEGGGAAEAAGVRAGDWIMSVNRESIVYSTHEQAVEIIKSNTESDTLVLDICTPK
ncbi:rhophilin-1-like isoform X2 [Halichondria panicea]|uniref:rhophilin-1-like isoform X2 n=1 Tax=Halichondria panicea TaxID=6063 RepID=UPI00312B2E3A